MAVPLVHEQMFHRDRTFQLYSTGTTSKHEVKLSFEEMMDGWVDANLKCPVLV